MKHTCLSPETSSARSVENQTNELIKNKKLQNLVDEAAHHLKIDLKYHQNTVYIFKRVFKAFAKYLMLNSIPVSYDEAGVDFIHEKFGNRTYRELSWKERFIPRGVKAFCEFEKSSSMQQALIPAHVNKQRKFVGEVGKIIQQFITHAKERGMTDSTIGRYYRKLEIFSNYCHEKEITSLENIDLKFVIEFLGQCDFSKPTGAHTMICTLRGFLTYCFDRQIIKLKIRIPRHRFVNQTKLPSTYTAEELKKMILTFDRKTKSGKRNFAMTLLGLQLGLRSSDIINLKFENIDWDGKKIILTQKKTEVPLTLTLTSDIGNALIDYIRNARPKSQERQIFLRLRPPFKRIKAKVGWYQVSGAFRKAGVNTEGKRRGSHSLRHSLATRMLQGDSSLSTIKDVLGHESSEATGEYLRIDLTSMAPWITDVPQLPDDLYKPIN